MRRDRVVNWTMIKNQFPAGFSRIADANTNRIGEGLRVLEEAARFILNDEVLSERLKDLRHVLSVRDITTKLQYLTGRDSQNDVGVEIQVGFQTTARSPTELVTANARRVEEALRVMEEISTLQGGGTVKRDYQRARFSLYDIEKELIGRLTRTNLASGIQGLYAIVDSDCLKGRDLLETTSQILAGGVKIVQLRDKSTPKKRLYELAIAVKQMCVENEALFIINDHMDIALAAGADGLHLGQEDLSVKIARKFLPIDKLIGCSVTTAAEARIAKSEGADYLACGAMYPTGTKTDCPVIGLAAVGEIKQAADLPLVAIGGINIDNVAEVLAAGVDSVAVVSALVLAHSPTLAAQEMLQRIEVCHEQA